MNPLKQKIIEKIKSEGPISFETFMEMALYYPGYGYYTKEATQIGKAGDFYTSPHLHPIFGAVLGKQMEEMWESLRRPEIFQIVEMGAGMGYLAKDMLEYLKQSAIGNRQSEGKEKKETGTVPLSSDDQKVSFFECVKYAIVEINPAIRKKQEELLAEFEAKIAWISDIKDIEPVTGCFISNELLDAFPVRIVETNEELLEIYVSVEDDDLIEIKDRCSDNIKDYFKSLQIDPGSFSKGYRTEVNLKLRDWLEVVGDKLAEGFIMTIDYGYPSSEYYDEERSKGTLLCYYRHQVNENPYRNIGEQDITAHVNFSLLKKWGEEFGLKTCGFCPQGAYLISSGIDEAIRDLYGDPPDAFEAAKIKGLILPQGMGESHKVMIQYKGDRVPRLRGFEIRNQIGRL